MKDPQQKHLARRLWKRHGGQHFCAVCGEPASAGGEAMLWLDPENAERGTILFVLCRLCRLVPYTERLNALHRDTWTARHRA
jgi:hypothetical protein